MDKAKKKQFIDYMHERLSSAETAILADYRGLNVESMTRLRQQMREAGVEFRVVKNTLTQIAAKGTRNESLASLLEGPAAIAMHETDVVAPARILVEFRKDKEIPVIKGGILEGRLISPAEVEALAKMPSREELLAKLVGGMSAGPQKLASLLAAQPRNLLGLLKALEEKHKSQAGAQEPQPA